VFLLLDICSAHSRDDVSLILEANNLHLLYIPPHSSHFLQCLDVSVFGTAKEMINRTNRTEDVNIQTAHIIQLVNGFPSAAVRGRRQRRAEKEGGNTKSGSTRVWVSVQG
jgi:hypothetical protein